MDRAWIVLLSLVGVILLGSDPRCGEAPDLGCVGALPEVPSLARALPASEGTPSSALRAPEAPLSRVDHPPISPIAA